MSVFTEKGVELSLSYDCFKFEFRLSYCFFPMPCASFCDKNGNRAHNRSFLLQTKRKAADRTFEQRFLE